MFSQPCFIMIFSSFTKALSKKFPLAIGISSFIIIASILILPACRNNPKAGTTVGLVTSSPTPLLPTAVSVPDSRPTSVIFLQTDLKSYTHTSNRFGLSYPNSWKLIERPDGVIFLEPTAKVGYSVVFSDVGERYNEQALNQYLVTFVAQNFAGEGSKFQPLYQEQQPDGSIKAEFTWNDPNLGLTRSAVQLFQQNTIIFILHISTPEEQWDVSSENIQQLINSFIFLDTSPNIAQPQVQSTAEPPTWALIAPTNRDFGFFYATDWEILEQTSNSVVVVLQNLDLKFWASSFSWPGAKEDSRVAEKATLAHIEMLLEEYDGVQNLPPTEFPLDTVTGSTADFFYTTDGGKTIAGSVITAAHKGKMYKIVFTAPAEVYEAGLLWFNPMYKSFKFLSPEDVFVEDP